MCDDSSGGQTDDSRYVFISQIGSGAYGSVFKARDKQTNEIVALKYVRKFSISDGLPLSFYRELNLLQSFQGSPNIIQYRRIAKITNPETQNIDLFIVLEYAHYDLSSIIDATQRAGLSLPFFQNFSKQILNGVRQLHENDYVHRDIKPANILINDRGEVKIADFGLTRFLPQNSKNRRFSVQVVTPGYRAPELLLGDHCYNKSIDIWSLGCLLYEMAVGSPLFSPSDSAEMVQLNTIFDICGTPTPESAPSLIGLPGMALISSLGKPRTSRLYETLVKNLPSDYQSLIPLLLSMLSLDPTLRPTIEEIIDCPFFSYDSTEIPTCLPLSLPEQLISSISGDFIGKNLKIQKIKQKSKQYKIKNTFCGRLCVSPPKITPPFVEIC